MRDRALEMARWLCSVQLESGAIPGGTIGREPAPTIFNTGQVLQGWCGAYRESRDESLRLPLVRAAEWLASVQDGDGCWRRWMSPLTLQTPATYNVRSASALLEAAELLDDSKLKKAAIKNFDWALSQQSEDGWFDNNCLTDTARPLTHTIGYTLEGLFDAAERLQEERYLAAVLRASNNLIGAVHGDGFLSGRFDAGWRPQVTWNCLTGSCQIALVWFRLSNLTGETRYRDEADKLLSFVKRTQKLGQSANGNGHSSSICGGVIGGIKGSHPVWGGYDPFCYPNWAAKFFADALLASSFNQ
jgi:hypothetical protein